MNYLFRRTVRTWLLFSILLTSTLTYGQIDFEQGYFIDNEGRKTDCLIKNEDWASNPLTFDYKTSENTEQKTATIQEIREFGIGTSVKYIRATTDIDRSSDRTADLNGDRMPVFSEETVFLRTIIEGEASLYRLGQKKRFFYSINNSPIEQLVYKRFLNQDDKIGYNFAFRNQLREALKCESISFPDIKDLEYELNDLIAIFEKHNECMGNGSTNYEEKKKKGKFRLHLMGGIRQSSLTLKSPGVGGSIDFGNDLTPTFGLQAEFTLPFNKNKWAILVEPTYQSFKASVENTTLFYTQVADYSSIEIPLSVKYNMFLSDRSRLFLTGGLVLADLPLNSTVNNLEVNSDMNVILGIGYSMNDQYQITFRYSTPRSLTTSYTAWASEYPSFSLAVGYALFKTAKRSK